MNQQSAIQFWGANGKLLPSETFDRTIVYSTSLNASPVVLEQNRFPGCELPDLMFKQHVFVIHISDPITCECKERGTLRRVLKPKGGIVFCPSERPFHTRLDLEKGTHATNLFLALDPVFVRTTATKVETISDRIELVPRWRGGGDPTLYHIALALQNGFRTGDASYPIYTEALSTALTIHLLREYGGAKLPSQKVRGELSRQKLNRALNYIQDRLSSGLSLSDVAAAVGLSTYHFARLFKHSTVKAPHQYLLDARVRKAKELLATGKFTVSEAAHEVGFFDQSHLTRHFKRVFGLPPKALFASAKRGL
jgi:AraC family transcriptional regulator